MGNDVLFEMIKTQWSWGVYKSVDDLQVYVNAGWITAEQAKTIAEPASSEAGSAASTATASGTTAN